MKKKIKYCIDPFKRHRREISCELICLDEDSVFYLEKILNKQYNQEQKVCATCKMQIDSSILDYKKTIEMSPIQESSKESTSQSFLTNSTPEEAIPSTQCSEYKSESQKKRLLDSYLETFNMPPFKRQKLSDSRVVMEGVEIMQNIVAQVSDAFHESTSVEMPNNLKNIVQLHEKSLDLDSIISNLEKKYRISTYNEKLSILALLPDEWTLQKIKEHFYCTPYMLREAKKLKQQGKYKIISSNKFVIKFFTNKICYWSNFLYQ